MKFRGKQGVLDGVKYIRKNVNTVYKREEWGTNVLRGRVCGENVSIISQLFFRNKEGGLVKGGAERGRKEIG